MDILFHFYQGVKYRFSSRLFNNRRPENFLFSQTVIKGRSAAVNLRPHFKQGGSIYFLWDKKNLRVKSCLEHRLFLAAAVVSAQYRVGTKG